MKPGTYVVVRTYSAGVHVGELIEQNGKKVKLANARRIWHWCGANTLSEISQNGVGNGSGSGDGSGYGDGSGIG